MKKFYACYSLVSALVCLSAFFVLFFVYRNVHGCLWACLAAVLAANCFALYSLYLADKLQFYTNAEALERLTVISFVLVLLCSTFFIWYIFTAVYWKIPFSDYERTAIFPCVFSFISGKWGLHLYYISKEFSAFLSSNFSPLIQSA